VTQNSVGEWDVLVYIDARKNVPERRFGLRPSEKELRERRSALSVTKICVISKPGNNVLFITAVNRKNRILPLRRLSQ
jgi:predicted metallo-beta-lactamase superfamily hydrolase